MEKQFLFINEQTKIQKLFKDFLGVEYPTIVNNEFMFLMTDIVDGVVLKLEYSVSQDPIAMYGNLSIGSTYRGQESLLVKAGQMVKHILEIRSAKQLKQAIQEVNTFVNEQDCLESFGKKEGGLEKLVITGNDNGGGLDKL